MNDVQARRAALLAEAERLRRLNDPERARRRLARTVRVSNPSSTDEERAAEVERLFRAIRPDPQLESRMGAIRRALARQ